MNSIRACVVGASLVRRLIYDQRIFLGFRSLYTAQFLNLDKYVEGRELTIKQYGNMKDNFMTRMKQQVESSSSAVIFTDDLKSVVHLCTSNDLDICKKMIKKFHHQNKELRFGTFVFGPVVMRMLYHLEQVDLALELIKDPEIDGFFDQLKSYFLIMDLLFKNERYQDVIDLNETLIQKKLLDSKYPRDCFVIMCASCLQLNTPESYEYAVGLVTNARTEGVEIIQRALHFVCLLALKQGKPEVAMELISSVQNKNTIHANNLKLLTLAHLNRLNDAINMLRRKTEEDFPSQGMVRGDFCQSVLDEVQKAVETVNDTEIAHQFEQVSRSLKEGKYLTDEALEDMLLTPINPRQFPLNRQGFGFGDRDQRNRQGGMGGMPRRFQGGPNEGYPNVQRREPVRRQALGSILVD